jgi:deazaflavin-dependent oxidoreductase (nitroreductase family)
MTASTTVKTPPRALIRVFWMLHRAAYRLTRGRFGLGRPETGARFGMLRLTTVGRRSGKTRRTMLGYYEDGPNLVTLAMNGWGETDPAWWLNLQAQPNATVELPGGTRSVRARVADGAERERLWATFRDYPGWGDDLDGLVACRPVPTAIVVLEPSDGAPPPSATADGPTGRRLRRRHLWFIPGLSIAFLASGLAQSHGLGLTPLLLFAITPHLPALIGVREARRPGHISARAVPLFNAMHQPVLPAGIVMIAATGLLPTFWLVGGLAWLSHIVMDWALAAGSRRPDGGGHPEPVERLAGLVRRPATSAGGVR